MEKIFAPKKDRELVRGRIIHARKSWKKHDAAARRLELQYRKVGISSIVLSAIVGASVFASLEAAFEPWSRIIAGIISISASVLSSLLTFHKYEERTEQHRAAGADYKAGLRALEKMHTKLVLMGRHWIKTASTESMRSLTCWRNPYRWFLRTSIRRLSMPTKIMNLWRMQGIWRRGEKRKRSPERA